MYSAKANALGAVQKEEKLGKQGEEQSMEVKRFFYFLSYHDFICLGGQYSLELHAHKFKRVLHSGLVYYR